MNDENIIVFRIDFSKDAGGGHLSRSITLSEELINRGYEVVFVMPDINSTAKRILQKKKIIYQSINSTNTKEDAEKTGSVIKAMNSKKILLVIDHYNIDEIWMQEIRGCVDKIVVIDDLANRRLECDLVINQVYRTDPKRYKDLTPKYCKVLTGSDYTTLNKKFYKQRLLIKELDEKKEVKKIHLLFGSRDPMGLCELYALNIKKNFPKLKLVINTTDMAPERVKIESLSKRYEGIEYRINSKNIARDMSKCQFAIGTPGMTTWERACLGIPSIQVGSAENQTAIMKELHRNRICYWAGMANEIKQDEFIEILEKLLNDNIWRNEVRRACLQAIDGLGTIRVANEIVDLFKSK